MADISQYLKVWLRFDDAAEPYKDECGNTWVGYGAPTVSADNAMFGKALQLNGEDQCLEMRTMLDLGDRDFTIDGWIQVRPETRASEENGFPFVFYLNEWWSGGSMMFRGDMAYMLCGLKIYPGEYSQSWEVFYSSTANVADGSYFDYIHVYVPNSSDYEQQWHHFAIVYQRELQSISLFVDGTLEGRGTNCPKYDRAQLALVIGAQLDMDYEATYVKGAVDDFRIVDGMALYTANFEPPTKREEPDGIIVADVFDALRQISHKLIMTPTENGVFTDEENTSGVQSIEIDLSAQQLTDNFRYTTINAAEIMQAVKGQYLDYHFNLRIERIQRRGILATCQCCSDVDELLYTQIAYKIPEVFWAKQQWHTEETTDSGESPAITVDGGGGKMVITYHRSMSVENANKQPKALASVHAGAIAEKIGKTLRIHIDDFVSTVDIEQGGSTYADLIGEIFGWTSRIPTLQINCYIRDDTLFVIQRGYEQNVVDLSEAKYAMPNVMHELIRTYWYGNTWTKTETRTVAYWKLEEQPPEYTYEDEENKISSNTKFSFDDDGLVSRSTRDEYKTNSDGSQTHLRVETTYEYCTLGYAYVTRGNGRKFLYRETTRTYEDGILTDTQIIEHTPLGQGQSYTYASDEDSDYLGSNVGRGKDDDRYNRGVKSIFYPADEWVQDRTENQSRTIPGITPFDTSFPVYGRDKLIEITDAIKALNRRTQETVTVDIYDLPHVIDFNDQIVFGGKTYFLVSNFVVKTARIVNKQTVTMVRWF